MAIKSLSHSSLLDNQYYRSMLVGNAKVSYPAYDFLEEEVLASNQTSVTFSNLNSSYGTIYQHLQIRFTARVTENIGGNIGTFYAIANSDTGSNYSRQVIRNSGSTALSSGSGSLSTADIGNATGSGAPAGAFAAGVIDIIDPFDANKNLVATTFTGSGNPYEVGIWSWMWNNTSALTAFSLETYGTHSFVQYSRFSLYGLRGA